MSKMGQFVYAVQEVVADNYNEPLDIVKQKVREAFNSEYAVRIAEDEYNQIISDFDEFSRLMYSSSDWNL